MASKMKTERTSYQKRFLDLAETTCWYNRKGIIKMLLSNLDQQGNRHVQNIISKMKKKRNYSIQPTNEELKEDEDAWFELPEAEEFVNWAGRETGYQLINFIKELLTHYRQNEISVVLATYTYHAKHPERAVSRRKSEPAKGWWSAWAEGDIVAVDCEMVSKILGYKSDGSPRCEQLVRTVAIVSFTEEIIYQATIKHNPDELHFTKIGKEITGFRKEDMLQGKDMALVKEELHQIFQNKLLIFIGAGSDFLALGKGAGLKMEKHHYEVFDLHQYYFKSTGVIGLRSLVMHFYKVDVQAGVHTSEKDAIYTMKIFKEQYIPAKLANPHYCMERGGTEYFEEIKSIQRTKKK